MKYFKKIIFLILTLISKLPFKILYIISDILFIIFYYIIRYRRKTTKENLRNSFPEKSQKELITIEKQFYHYICDLMVEFIKNRSLKKEELLKRVEFRNIELLEDLYNSGKNVIGVCAHSGNFDWLSMKLALISKYEVYGIVKPLSDRDFDKYFNEKLRSRFTKNRIIYFKQTFRTIIKLTNENRRFLICIASDQTPHKDEIEYTTKFLNQDTPVFLGVEKMAKKLDLAVIFFDMRRKEKRGYYYVDISLLTDNPSETKDFEITELHVKKLENIIKENPYNWFWSHRRWKYVDQSNKNIV